MSTNDIYACDITPDHTGTIIDCGIFRDQPEVENLPADQLKPVQLVSYEADDAAAVLTVALGPELEPPEKLEPIVDAADKMLELHLATYSEEGRIDLVIHAVVSMIYGIGERADRDGNERMEYFRTHLDETTLRTLIGLIGLVKSRSSNPEHIACFHCHPALAMAHLKRTLAKVGGLMDAGLQTDGHQE